MFLLRHNQELFSFIQAQVAVETIASKYVTVTTRQPEIVNTALLNGNTVTSQLYYSVIGNDIAVRNLSSPTQTASKIVEPTLLNIECSSSGPLSTLKVAGESCLAVSYMLQRQKAFCVEKTTSQVSVLMTS